MLHHLFSILFLGLFAIQTVQAEVLKCTDTSGRYVTAEVLNIDMMQADKAMKAVLTAQKSDYSSPIVDTCSTTRVGEPGIVVQANWSEGLLSVFGYDALSSLISFSYGGKEGQTLAEDLHLSVYVKASSETSYHRLLDAVLGKENKAAHNLQVRYMHEQTPNQQQDVLLVWNTATKTGEKQPLNVLGVRYQYDGVKVQR